MKKNGKKKNHNEDRIQFCISACVNLITSSYSLNLRQWYTQRRGGRQFECN